MREWYQCRYDRWPVSNREEIMRTFEEVFTYVGHQPIKDISTVENLAAVEVDPMATAQASSDRVLDPVRGLIPTDVVSSIEEQLSGSCTTESAGCDEFTGMLTNHELREKYDNIVMGSYR